MKFNSNWFYSLENKESIKMLKILAKNLDHATKDLTVDYDFNSGNIYIENDKLYEFNHLEFTAYLSFFYEGEEDITFSLASPWGDYIPLTNFELEHNQVSDLFQEIKIAIVSFDKSIEKWNTDDQDVDDLKSIFEKIYSREKKIRNDHPDFDQFGFFEHLKTFNEYFH